MRKDKEVFSNDRHQLLCVELSNPNFSLEKIGWVVEEAFDYLEESMRLRLKRGFSESSKRLPVRTLSNMICQIPINDRQIVTRLNSLEPDDLELFLLATFRNLDVPSDEHVQTPAGIRLDILQKLSNLPSCPTDIFVNLAFSDRELAQKFIVSVFGRYGKNIKPAEIREIILSSSEITKEIFYQIMSGKSGISVQDAKCILALRTLAKSEDQKDHANELFAHLITGFPNKKDVVGVVDAIGKELESWTESEFQKDKSRDYLRNLSKMERKIVLLWFVSNNRLIPLSRLRAISFWAEAVGEEETELLTKLISQDPRLRDILYSRDKLDKMIVDAEELHQHFPTPKIEWLVEYLKYQNKSGNRGYESVRLSTRASLITILMVRLGHESEQDINIEKFTWYFNKMVSTLEDGENEAGRKLFERSTRFIDIALGLDFDERDIDQYRIIMELLDSVVSLSPIQRKKAVQIMLSDVGFLERHCDTFSRVIANISAMGIEDRIRKFVGLTGSLYDQSDEDLQKILNFDAKLVDNARAFLVDVIVELKQTGNLDDILLFFEDSVRRMDDINQLMSHQRALVLKTKNALSNKSYNEDMEIETVEREMIIFSQKLAKVTMASIMEELSWGKDINISDLSQKLIDLAIVFRLGSSTTAGENFLTELTNEINKVIAGGIFQDLLSELMVNLAFDFQRYGLVVNLPDSVNLAIIGLPDIRYIDLYDQLLHEYTSAVGDIGFQPDTEAIAVIGASLNPVTIAHQLMFARFARIMKEKYGKSSAVVVLLAADKIKEGKHLVDLGRRINWAHIATSHLPDVRVNVETLEAGTGDRGVAAAIIKRRHPKLNYVLAAGIDKLPKILDTDDPESLTDSSHLVALRGQESANWDMLYLFFSICPNSRVTDLPGGAISSTMARRMLDNGWGRLVSLLLGPETTTIVREWSGI